MQAILTEMGLKEGDVTTLLGERPSYDAQMKMLTKQLYQTPEFYINLYDKPANIDRKIVSMQAIGSMQNRDKYLSQRRIQQMSAVWLDTYLDDTEEEFTNETENLKGDTPVLDLPGL